MGERCYAGIHRSNDEYYTYTFTGWEPEIVAVTANATYTAQFSTSTRTYTVIWKDGDGNILKTDDNLTYGAMPHYNGTTPTKTATEQCSYVFAGWSPEVVPVAADAIYEASFQSMTTAGEGEIVQIVSNSYITTTTVEAGGGLNVADNKTLYTENLILKATPSSSGEISGNVTTQNALFDFSQPGGFKARTWYAVAVPWQVDVPAYNKANCGVYTKSGAGDFVQQTLGNTFDLIYYDGARRATGASKAWNYVEDDAAEKQIMLPGRAYMIYLASDAEVIRFKKSAEADLHTYDVNVVKYPSELIGNYADWNGIANPATYKATLNVGTTDNKGQVYNPETGQYELINLSEQRQVGQPFFVQPIKAKTVIAEREIQGGSMTGSPDDPFAAPRRRTAARETPLIRYEVLLTQSEDRVTDRIIVRLDEDKETDNYVVGHDLAKMGVSSKVPQMWVNRYNTPLCINTAIQTNNQAEFPLSIYAPAAGEYTISMDQMTNDQSPITNNYTLYLTYDNRVVWNLTYAPYVMSLENETNTHYGLRIVYTPQISTEIEQTTIQDDATARKMIIEDKVYIFRGDKVYTIDGKVIK